MKKGFTLIEILVVVAILGILLAMSIPAAGMIMRRAKRAQAQADASVVVSTMTRYNAEYNRWPSFYKPKQKALTDKEWLDTMYPPVNGPMNINNMKKIVFLNPGKGTVELDENTGEAQRYIDPWGQEFCYEIDADRDGLIDHPDPAENTTIRARVIAWSGGPDKDLDTWENNVTSWE